MCYIRFQLFLNNLWRISTFEIFLHLIVHQITGFYNVCNLKSKIRITSPVIIAAYNKSL